jgi:hypothetical protein
MNNLTVLAIFILPIAALLIFIFARKKVRRIKMTVSTCGSTAYPGGTLRPDAWHIGPNLLVFGNKSPGMPPHPSPDPQGFSIDLPVGVNLPLKTGPKLGYVTFNHGPLTGRREIRMTYTLTHDVDTLVLAVPEQNPEAAYPAQITLYFQREGDDWTGAGKYESYRWYATFSSSYLRPGTHTIIVPLDGNWSAIATSTAANNPLAFQTAKAEACCVGFVCGGNEVGYGHGIRATGPAKFTVHEFSVI